MDLIINCYEKTYREVMTSAYWERVVSWNNYNFDAKILLINNVEDLVAVTQLAKSLVEAHVIDKYYVVEEWLPKALEITGLTIEDLGNAKHFSDCALVAVTIPEGEWFVYWDAGVRLVANVDWITPCTQYMESHLDILVANPMWDEGLYGVNRECLFWDGDFSISYAFSDQLFLSRRSSLAQKIYKYSTIASLRYPMSHIVPVFEQQIDAYMRTQGRKRITYSKAQMLHHTSDAGTSHIKGTPEQMRAREMHYKLMEMAANLPPGSPYHNHPAWVVNPK